MNYLELKLQDATTIGADALSLRGFQVKVSGGSIEFLSSSAKPDMEQAAIILNKLGIPFTIKNYNLIEILVTKIPLSIYNKVARFGGQPYSIPYREYQTKWRYFYNHRFGVRLDALSLEYNMAAFVKTANLAGIRIVSGCNGHKKNSPRFQVVGEYYGAWFEVIQQMYLQDLTLNYKWEVMYQGTTKAEIRAVGTDWDMDRIHQDTMKMAARLQQNAQSIRELKSQVFVKQASEPKMFVEKKQYAQLVNWMMQRCKEYVAFNY